MLEIIEETIIDGVKLLPFLFIAYLIMEYIEHKMSGKTKKIIKKSGKYGPLLGGILGAFPQCGFSAVASNLYAGRIISMGTLIAIFLSTSDEMLPVLISERAPWQTILLILSIKVIIGIISGFAIDFIINIYRKSKKIENEEGKISEICEHDNCHCENSGVVKSAIKHTVSIFFFIIIITFLLNTAIHYIGEENISNWALNIPVIGKLIAGLIGLIPNCAGSVILTQLYLQNIISLGSIICGLLVGSGVGILILFRVNKHLKENLKIVSILYVIGTISGIIIDLIC